MHLPGTLGYLNLHFIYFPFNLIIPKITERPKTESEGLQLATEELTT